MAVTLISKIKPQESKEPFFIIDSDDVDISAGINETSTFPTTSLTNFIKNIEESIEDIENGNTTAGTAEKLNIPDTGSATNPVYFVNGIPVETEATLEKNINGNAITATTASKLSTSAGDINTPVYFNDGIPEVCTSLDLDTSGSAAKLAVTGTIQIDLTSNSTTTYTDGGNITPGVSGILNASNGGTSNTTGRVQIGQKSDVAIGTNATSEGNDTQATGDYSHAEGSASIASGNYSHAEGKKCGDLDHIASGEASHIEGLGNQALNTACHAEGSNNIVGNGSSSHVEGNSNIAYGVHIHVEGSGNTVGTKNNENIDYLAGAHAEGCGNIIENGAGGSHAEGGYNIITNPIGGSSTAAWFAHVEGSNNTVSAQSAHAEGHQTIASGDYSHTEGRGTQASGIGSHAGGNGTKASGDYQTTIGKFNIEDTENTYALLIGNGTAEDTRSNAFGVDWNGNTYISGKLAADSIGTYMITPGDTENTNISIINEAQNATLSINNKPVPTLQTTQITLSSGKTSWTITTDINGNSLNNRITASSTVFISPSPTSFNAYLAANIYCSDQEDGSLTFISTGNLSADVNVNVAIFN